MEPDLYPSVLRPSHQESDDHDTITSMIYLAAQCDCLEIVDMACYDMFGHDRVTRLSMDELRDLHRRIRPAILKRARRLGMLPQFNEPS
ncbi:hypothetical protein GWI72_10535 [Microvirga tunisiensis]|uniref:Uncharacterized protein n=1 Tax=Pannonibacter tanglangensis TaxID=2750084 RepID=A0A7X5F2W2_9HYPH|nr:hypothetical protein [Pannonibacter sp. XCT-53]NBN78703.1 hypothetical protein [Pannonibacter sp. XCT-53]